MSLSQKTTAPTAADLAAAFAIFARHSRQDVSVREVLGRQMLVVWVNEPCRVTAEECRRLESLGWVDAGSKWTRVM